MPEWMKTKSWTTLFITTLDTMTKFDTMSMWLSRIIRSRDNNLSQIMQEYCIWYFIETYISDICYNPKHMYNEKLRINHGLSYISFCPLMIRYNSKFIILATSLWTNAAIVTRVHCIRSDKLKETIKIQCLHCLSFILSSVGTEIIFFKLRTTL